jgi:hypothetical protein
VVDGQFTAAVIAAPGSTAGAQMLANGTASSTTPAAHAERAGTHKTKKHKAKKAKAKDHKATKQQGNEAKAGKHPKKSNGAAAWEWPSRKGTTTAVRKASEILLAPTWTEAQQNAGRAATGSPRRGAPPGLLQSLLPAQGIKH